LIVSRSEDSPRRPEAAARPTTYLSMIARNEGAPGRPLGSGPGRGRRQALALRYPTDALQDAPDLPLVDAQSAGNLLVAEALHAHFEDLPLLGPQLAEEVLQLVQERHGDFRRRLPRQQGQQFLPRPVGLARLLAHVALGRPVKVHLAQRLVHG